MRILCLTSRLPYPPDRGDRLRAFHFFEHLAQAHELTLVSFIARDEERDHLPALAQFFGAIHVLPQTSRRSALAAGLNVLRPYPLQALYYRSARMQRLVDEVVSDGRFQVAYSHLFRMAPYLENHDHLYRIVDLTDVISEEIRRSLPYRGRLWRGIYSLEKPRIERYERQVARQFEETWLISETDRQVLAAACPEANIQVVTNGVDLETFQPTGQTVQPHRLIFVGHLRVFHNIDAALFLAQEILPLVRRQIPDCTLHIVGADPAPQVRQLAVIDTAVTVPGFVPDLNAALNGAALFVAPLRFAAGVQNKVLEAMAAGRPVVTTSLVNGGIGAEPGQDLWLADTAVEIAQAIVTLLRQDERRQRLGQAGREFVRQQFSWHGVLDRMEAISQSLEPSG